MTHKLLSFDEKGNILKSSNVFNSWENIIDSSHKTLSFIDCPGFDTYKSNNVESLLSSNPDYSILVVSALKNKGEIKDQIKLAIALRINFCITVTHTDKADSKTMNSVLKIVASKDQG